MLTESEKKWLEERSAKTCASCRSIRETWCPICVHDSRPKALAADCYSMPGLDLFPDWKDCAEFEARVAVYLAQSPCLTCPSTIYGNCETRKTAKGREVIEACRLKHARLTVEEEM